VAGHIIIGNKDLPFALIHSIVLDPRSRDIRPNIGGSPGLTRWCAGTPGPVIYYVELLVEVEESSHLRPQFRA
jgi:hypothetical protein